jgi:hypothetical protein
MRQPNEIIFRQMRNAWPLVPDAVPEPVSQDYAGGLSSAGFSFPGASNKNGAPFITFQTRTKRLVSGKMPTTKTERISN